MNKLILGMVLGILLCGIFASFANAATDTDKCKVEIKIYGYSCSTANGIVSYGNAYADIYINGQRVKKGSSYATIPVAPGEVTVSLKRDGYSAEPETFNCPAGATIKRDFHLDTDGCFLSTIVSGIFPSGVSVKNVLFFVSYMFESTFSDTRIYVDGKKYKNCQILSLGTHTVKAHKFGYQSDATEVTCSEKNQQLMPGLTLVKNPQNCIPKVRIYNETVQKNGKKKPMWAELYVDGYNIGWVKNKAIRFEAGKTYSLQAKRDGYASEIYTFECNAKERKNWDLTLKKI